MSNFDPRLESRVSELEGRVVQLDGMLPSNLTVGPPPNPMVVTPPCLPSRGGAAEIWRAAVVIHRHSSPSGTFRLAVDTAEREWDALVKRRAAPPSAEVTCSFSWLGESVTPPTGSAE